MKIVAILGSPHGAKGNTALLLREVIRGAEDRGAAVTTLSLSDHKVEPCLACDACHKTGTCPRPDAYPTFRDALEQADGIIFAGPNYLFSVSAQMKALMDRCCGLLHVQRLRDKHAAAVVASGGEGSPEVERYLVRFLRALGCWTVGSVGASAAQLADPSARAPVFEAAADLGRRLADAIRNKATFPDQAAERAAFRELMRQLVIAHKDVWTYEYDYWKSQG